MPEIQKLVELLNAIAKDCDEFRIQSTAAWTAAATTATGALPVMSGTHNLSLMNYHLRQAHLLAKATATLLSETAAEAVAAEEPLG